MKQRSESGEAVLQRGVKHSAECQDSDVNCLTFTALKESLDTTFLQVFFFISISTFLLSFHLLPHFIPSPFIFLSPLSTSLHPRTPLLFLCCLSSFLHSSYPFCLLTWSLIICPTLCFPCLCFSSSDNFSPFIPLFGLSEYVYTNWVFSPKTALC